jgi:hypothetical protein
MKHQSKHFDNLDSLQTQLNQNLNSQNKILLFLPFLLGHAEGKFLVTKFEFGGSLGMSLEGDCHEVEVTPNLELLVTFGKGLEGVCHDLYT